MKKAFDEIKALDINWSEYNLEKDTKVFEETRFFKCNRSYNKYNDYLNYDSWGSSFIPYTYALVKRAYIRDRNTSFDRI